MSSHTPSLEPTPLHHTPLLKCCHITNRFNIGLFIKSICTCIVNVFWFYQNCILTLRTCRAQTGVMITVSSSFNASRSSHHLRPYLRGRLYPLEPTKTLTATHLQLEQQLHWSKEQTETSSLSIFFSPFHSLCVPVSSINQANTRSAPFSNHGNAWSWIYTALQALLFIDSWSTII